LALLTPHSLNKRQHAAHGTLIGVVNPLGGTELALALAAFLGEDMAVVRLTSLEATTGCATEPLGGTAIGFHLWHIVSPA
jgi:hypothetical protein